MPATQSRSHHLAILVLSATCLIASGLTPATAEDPVEIEIEYDVAVPLLEKIPYVSRLFTGDTANACAVVPGTAEACLESCCSESVELSVAVLDDEHLCPEFCIVCSHDVEVDAPYTEMSKAQLWEELVGALQEATRFEAALEAREEIDEQRSELTDALVESAVENARLEAELEVAHRLLELNEERAEERLEYHAELAAAKAENAALQGKMELIAQHQAVWQQLAQAGLENAQLKAQVAKLEATITEIRVAQRKPANQQGYRPATVAPALQYNGTPKLAVPLPKTADKPTVAERQPAYQQVAPAKR